MISPPFHPKTPNDHPYIFYYNPPNAQSQSKTLILTHSFFKNHSKCTREDEIISSGVLKTTKGLSREE